MREGERERKGDRQWERVNNKKRQTYRHQKGFIWERETDNKTEWIIERERVNERERKKGYR